MGMAQDKPGNGQGDEMHDMSDFEEQFEEGGDEEAAEVLGDEPFQPLQQDHERADKVEASSIEWLDEEELGQRIPLGMLTLVAGRPGQGKSIWTADLAARISRTGKGVIFSNLEDPLGPVVKPRLEAAGAVLDRIHFWNPTLPRDTETLETMITAL